MKNILVFILIGLMSVLGGLEDITKQVIVFSAFVLAIIVIYNKQIQLKRDFLPPFLFSLVSLASILYTINVWVGIYYSASMLTGSMFYLIIRNNDRDWREKAIWVFLVCGIIHGFFALYSVLFGAIPGLFKASKYTLGLFYNSNIYSGFIAPLIPLSLYAYYTREKHIYAWIASSLIFFNLLSNSRGGAVAMFLGIILIGIFFALFKKKRQIMILLLVVGVGIACYIGLKNFIPNQSGIPEMEQKRIDQRYYHFDNSLKLFLKAPILGHGINSYRDAVTMVSNTDKVEHVSHSHNLFLNILVEMGLIGLFLFLIFLFMVFRGRLFNSAFFFKTALITFLVHNLVEYNFAYPIFQILFYSLCAFIIYERDVDIKTINLKEGNKSIITALVVVYFLVVVYPQVAGFLFLKRFNYSLEDGDIKRAYNNLMLANYFGYAVSNIHEITGTFYEEIYFIDREKNKEFFKLAEKQYMRAWRLNRMNKDIQKKIEKLYKRANKEPLKKID